MANKKTAKKTSKKTAKKTVAKTTRKKPKTVKKRTTKKTTIKKQQVVAKKIAWMFFGNLLLLAVVLYGLLYMLFEDPKQGGAIILGALAVWLLIKIIKYLRKNR